MKLLSNTLSVLLSLALLAALGFGIFVGFQAVTNFFADLNKPLAAILATASVVVLLSAVIVAGGIRRAMKRESDQQLRAERAAVYGRFIETLQQSISQRDLDTGKTRAFSQALKKDMILWASNSVLKQFAALQKIARELWLQDQEFLAQVEKVLLEMRQDLGQTNWGLKERDVLDLLQGNSDSGANGFQPKNAALRTDHKAYAPV